MNISYQSGGFLASPEVAKALNEGASVKSVADKIPEPSRTYLLSGKWRVSSVDSDGWVSMSYRG